MAWHMRIGALSLLLASILPGAAARADEQLCNAYSKAAAATVALAQQHNCGFTGPRWDPSAAVHKASCMGWSDGFLAYAETIARANDLLSCESKEANQPVPMQLSAPPVFKSQPTLQAYCDAYGLLATQQVRAAQGLNCGYGGIRWSSNILDHTHACMSWADTAGDIGGGETNTRIQDLVACEVRMSAASAPTPPPSAPAPPPTQTGQPVSVTQGVDVYDSAGGNGAQTGTLAAGTPDVVLLAPCTDNWCHVQWPDGEGWVYNGPDYPSLNVP